MRTVQYIRWGLLNLLFLSTVSWAIGEIQLAPPYESFTLRRDSEMTLPYQTFLGDTEWGFEQIKFKNKTPGLRIRTFQPQASEYYSLLSKQTHRIAPLSGSKHIIGTYALIPKPVKIDHEIVTAFLGTNLAISPTHGRRGLGKILLKQAREMSLATYSEKQRIDYAYVEKANLSSYRAFVSSGYESLGQFSILHFSREKPAVDLRVGGLSFKDRDEMIDLLDEFYQDHVLTSFAFSLIPQFYHVIKDHDGTILAGVQVSTPTQWHIQQLKGIGGWFALNVAPWIPILTRYVSRDLHFITFENLYVKKDHEYELAHLMSHLLSIYNVNNAVVGADLRGKMISILRTNNLGILNAMAGENSMELMVYSDNLDPSVRKRIRRGPIYP